jgi:hypothetical protein
MQEEESNKERCGRRNEKRDGKEEVTISLMSNESKDELQKMPDLR